MLFQPTNIATNSPENNQRCSVIKQTQGTETMEGAGVNIRRHIASPDLDMLDPFLL
jgi:hypothetical protein